VGRHLLPKCCAVLGGDVGWSAKRKSSAGCYLVFDEASATVKTTRFTAQPTDLSQSLSDLVSRRPLLPAAFDGPGSQTQNRAKQINTIDIQLLLRD
jgi:hypothetical protein